ncbi:MAG: hypothetical protein ACTSRU_09295 [Candidatus Hodarchaeales archaeon]
MLAIPRTSTITIRLPLEIIHDIEHYAELLRLKPSSFCAMIIKDSMKDWIKDYAEKIYADVKDL